jgi:hypothetical protein
VTDGELQIVLGDQFHSGGLVVGRQRDDLGIHAGESFPGPLELDALVAELGSTRNAIYKTMFDARRKLRAALAANGYLDDQTSRQS